MSWVDFVLGQDIPGCPETKKTGYPGVFLEHSQDILVSPKIAPRSGRGLRGVPATQPRAAVLGAGVSPKQLRAAGGVCGVSPQQPRAATGSAGCPRITGLYNYVTIY